MTKAHPLRAENRLSGAEGSLTTTGSFLGPTLLKPQITTSTTVVRDKERKYALVALLGPPQLWRQGSRFSFGFGKKSIGPVLNPIDEILRRQRQCCSH
jgi:hypothetical protein